MGEALEVEITQLGARGDGVAECAGEPVYVPFALPGERWRLDGGGPKRLTESPERSAPVCRHFGLCGGCVAQHMSRRLQDAWKRDIVVNAFRHRGIAADVAPLRRLAAHSRRRAFLGVERRGSNVVIGFREEGQHKLVDVEECPVLDPKIVTALGRLRNMARVAMPEGQGGRLVVTRLDGGLDVSFDNGSRALEPAARAELAALAQAAGLVRLTVGGEPIFLGGAAAITIDGVAVEPVQGAFLQAVPEAEALLIGHVLAALPPKARRVADLFSGIGTFTFALARRAPVSAFDSDKRAIGALAAAAKRAQGLKPIEARARDLFRDPLSARELEAFDAVVLDPPRAGACAQAERIAKSKVRIVIAVSCNPATLARDARTLIDGGYKLGTVTPIDQFIYSPHVEAVTVLCR
jgi:23S rRNA (uracil1939-C5)-methyltransferase